MLTEDLPNKAFFNEICLVSGDSSKIFNAQPHSHRCRPQISWRNVRFLEPCNNGDQYGAIAVDWHHGDQSLGLAAIFGLLPESAYIVRAFSKAGEMIVWNPSESSNLHYPIIPGMRGLSVGPSRYCLLRWTIRGCRQLRSFAVAAAIWFERSARNKDISIIV